MANKGLSDILTKLSTVLKHDMYLVDWRYCIGGQKTEAANPGTVICVLEEDEVSVFKSLYKENNLVYIEDIKKYKTEPAKYEKLKFKDDVAMDVRKKRDMYIKLVNGAESWKEFKLDEKEMDRVFTKGSLVGLDVSNNLNVLISKQLFPLVKPTELDSLRYSIIRDKVNRGGFFLAIKHIHPMFIFYNILYYLSL